MHEIIPSTRIDQLLRQRDQAVEQARIAHANLQASVETCQAAGIGAMHAPFSGGYHAMAILHPEWIQKASAAIDAGAWDFLMRQSGLFTFMDATARAQWRKQIATCNTPPLTRENIETTFASLYRARREMFERGVLEVFHQLSWKYASNEPVKLGKKIILSGILCVWGLAAEDKCNAVDDLNRALHVLDQQPEPDHRQGLANTLRTLNRNAAFNVENDYFRLRVYPTARTAHINFKRLDLVDQLNGILAKHYPNALPA